LERAVVQNRYSLAVLTPTYLENNFTEFESILAQHLGLENGQRRLLAIKYKTKMDVAFQLVGSLQVH
jgi:hypothetical protein